MANGKIQCFVDIASYYSYIAFADLLPNLDLLAAHGVEVEFVPVLIAGINTKSGNKPPWTLPAKAKYLRYDANRSKERVGKTGIAFPQDFLSMALTVLPQRAMHYVKRKYPPKQYLTVLHYMFHVFWTPPHKNLTKEEVLREALTSVPSDFPGQGAPLFSSQEVDDIIRAAGMQEYKDALTRSTDESVAKGAFGAPWIWVKNAQGVEEPFFGSDRFHHIYKFLDLPFREIELLPPTKTSKI
ncbi:uncharacterized protein PpBr36_05970 [Pyricularia pennisetigena]|uniref:uncharacterized protein n=1 Tax=Pyricularia pennisetigena TaxID=1578925 RepID=UPI001150232A|nr:uncharacterized protein PpBr36_05970 [Pyricularia pennisetigena]TLS23393.1 hypothetical protein PpBr36_05970 [Pyricularia pennisetigena]